MEAAHYHGGYANVAAGAGGGQSYVAVGVAVPREVEQVGLWERVINGTGDWAVERALHCTGNWPRFHRLL